MAVNAAQENNVFMLVAVTAEGKRTDVLSDGYTLLEALVARTRLLANERRELRQTYSYRKDVPVNVEIVPKDDSYKELHIAEVPTRDAHEAIGVINMLLHIHGSVGVDYRSFIYAVEALDWHPSMGYTLCGMDVVEYLDAQHTTGELSPHLINDRRYPESRYNGAILNA